MRLPQKNLRTYTIILLASLEFPNYSESLNYFRYVDYHKTQNHLV